MEKLRLKIFNTDVSIVEKEWREKVGEREGVRGRESERVKDRERWKERRRDAWATEFLLPPPPHWDKHDRETETGKQANR